MFTNREEAAYLLVEKLKKYKNSNGVVLAVPRGGVPLGCIISKELNLPLDIVLSKKIGHPFHKEFAIGAVTLKSRILSEGISEISEEYIENETEIIREILQKRYNDYYGNRKPQQLKTRIVFVVDDGIATGNTILATIAMLHGEKPKKIVIAIPVASPKALHKLESSPYIDEVVCLSTPRNFQAVGQFYKNFDQVNDLKIKKLLENCDKELDKNNIK
jgi:predicted phosphoribosyltransferase